LTLGRIDAVAQVFLSYAAPDRAIARKLVDDLTRYRTEVWYDQNLRPGDNWVEAITRNLEEASAVIVLITPDSLRSEWVGREWQNALIRSARVLPVLANGASFKDLPAALAKIQTIDLNRDYERGLGSIVSEVKHLQLSADPPASSVLDVQDVIEDIVQRVIKKLGVQAQHTTTDLDVADDKLVFVITSFAPDMEPIFLAVSAAAHAVGLRAERVKDVKGDYRITDKVLAMIRQARLIVVDLTHERPNVYFELGYARGLGKTVITILRTGTVVHFDVRDWTYLEYFDSRPLEGDLLERFKFELQQSAASEG
jgi:hypothetical protein